MRVALSVDMEAISGITTMRQCLAATDDYWDVGRPALVADVVAAAEGLLAGGATDVVVLDNHGSGNPANIGADEVPDGARVETWNLFDLQEHGVDAQLQLGYHARGGVDGFLSRAAHDPATLEELARVLDEWAAESQPEWHGAPAG